MIRCKRRNSLFLAASAVLMIPASSCSSEPEAAARDVAWSIRRLANKKGYSVEGSATYVLGVGGWYQPSVTLLDDKGCSITAELNASHVVDTDARGDLSARFAGVVPVTRPVATAQLQITHKDAPMGSLDPRTISRTSLYNQTSVVDPKVHPPENAANPCSKSRRELRNERQARLRNKAVTDPDGADAEAISGMSREEVVATAINSAGFLCARITSMYPSGGAIIVNCVEYRNGSGRAKYRVDASAGTVRPLS